MRRLFLLGLMTALPFAALACGDTEVTLPNPGPTDAAPPDDAGPTPHPKPRPEPGDAGDAGDAQPPSDDAGDAEAPPNGRQLATGENLVVHGTTPEGHVVFSSASDVTRVFRVSLGGGKPETIAEVPNGTKVQVDGSAVLFFTPLPFGDGSVGALAVWTKAHGLKAVSEAAVAGYGHVSPDGTKVGFFASEGSGHATTLAVAPADGSAPATTLLAVKAIASLEFAANGDLITSYSSPSAATPRVDSVSIFAPGATAETAHVDAASAVHDATGSWIWARTAAGGATLVRTSDGSVVLTDPQASAALFDPTGTEIVYLSGDAIRTYSFADGKVTTLVAKGAGGLEGLSPDGATLLYDPAATDDHTLWAVHTAATKAPWKTWKVQTPDARSPLVQFTTGGAHVLSTALGADHEPTLSAASTAGGPLVVLGPSRSPYVPLLGEQVLAETDEGTLTTFDTNDGTATRVATHAQSWAVSANQWAVAYATSAAPAGLYVVQVH